MLLLKRMLVPLFVAATSMLATLALPGRCGGSRSRDSGVTRTPCTELSVDSHHHHARIRVGRYHINGTKTFQRLCRQSKHHSGLTDSVVMIA